MKVKYESFRMNYEDRFDNTAAFWCFLSITEAMNNYCLQLDKRKANYGKSLNFLE